MVNLYLTYLEWCSEHLGELSHIMTRKEFEERIYNNYDKYCTTSHKDEKDHTTNKYQYCDTESYN